MKTTVFLLILNLSSHAAFIWARFVVFRIDGCTPRGTRLIEVSAAISLLAGAALIACREETYFFIDILAGLLSLFSMVLFGWGIRTVRRRRLTAAFCDDLPVELIDVGPFRYVRNPFYLSYILIYAQCVLASWSGWALVPFFWMAAIYVRAALLEEKKFLRSQFGEAYHKYMEETGRFVPNLFPKGGLLWGLKSAASRTRPN
jgi:protein-S-isoprenylcysteine O-methyltransferase Ste14